MTRITIPTVAEDQGRTLEDLLDMGKYLDQIVHIEYHFEAATITVRLASPYSFYKGAYQYSLEFVIEDDGSFSVEGADEALIDELDVRFTRESMNDPFVKIYKR